MEGLQSVRTWAEVDPEGEGDGGDESCSEFEAPCDFTDVLECEVGRETQHNPECRLNQ